MYITCFDKDIENITNITYHDKFAYFRPGNITDDGSNALFTLSFSTDNGATWYYVTHDEEDEDGKIEATPEINYDKCVFNFGSGKTETLIDENDVTYKWSDINYKGLNGVGIYKSLRASYPNTNNYSIKVDSYKSLTNQTTKKIFGNDGIAIDNNWSVIRVNAKELGWLSAERVGIRLTLISPRESSLEFLSFRT